MWQRQSFDATAGWPGSPDGRVRYGPAVSTSPVTGAARVPAERSEP